MNIVTQIKKENKRYLPHELSTKINSVKLYRQTKDIEYVLRRYAGADMVRKISQGNARIFIQLMHALFEKAKETTLEPKVQHRVIIQFTEKICSSTKSLQSQGPIISSCLDKIAQKLHDRIHGEYIVNNGASFNLSREEFNRIFKVYTKYEKFLDEHKMTNGEVDINYQIIKESYEQRLRDHAFIEDVRGYTSRDQQP